MGHEFEWVRPEKAGISSDAVAARIGSLSGGTVEPREIMIMRRGELSQRQTARHIRWMRLGDGLEIGGSSIFTSLDDNLRLARWVETCSSFSVSCERKDEKNLILKKTYHGVDPEKDAEYLFIAAKTHGKER